MPTAVAQLVVSRLAPAVNCTKVYLPEETPDVPQHQTALSL
jgi:hypothetical protein